MWILRKSATPGEFLRRIASLLTTSLLVATFVTVIASSTPTYAAPAQWSGDELTYEDNLYTPTNADLPDSSAEGDTRYMWINSLESPQKAYVIYFDTDQPQQAETAQLVVFDHVPPDDYGNPSAVQTIEVTIDLTGGPVEGGDVPLTTCDGSIMKGIGWILCPISNWIADGVDWMYRIVNDFLEVPIVSNDSSTGIYALWQVLLAIANVCFAVVFLVIIYSHLTSVGFSSYNIKVMLPRLLIAAVLVNISFWICALAIDISNLLGHSINNVFINIRENMPTGAEVDWSGLTLFIVSGGAVGAYLGISAAAAGSFGGLAFLLIAALAGVAFSVFVAFVILAARQAIITVLLILSPLAFVAFVLPSTQDLFNKWRKSFTTLLMLFPVFAILFGGSGVAGAAIMNAADGRLHIVLIGMATQVIPLVLTPLLIQFSSGLLGRIAGMANSSTRGWADRTKNWAHDNADALAANKRAKWQKMAADGNKRRYLNPMAMTGVAMDQGKRRRDRMKNSAEDYLDKSADKKWQQRLNNGQGRADRRLRQQYMDTHDLSEKAKTHQENLEGRANRHWQNSLATATPDSEYGQLSAMSSATIRDNKHAQFQASQIEARGERQFQADFEKGTAGSRELRKQRVDIEQTKKESASIENALQQDADAHWERISATDDNIKALRFEETAATDSHRKAAAEWTKIIEDVRLKGVDSDSVPVSGTDLSNRTRRSAGNIKAQSALAIIAEKATSDIKATHESRAQSTYIASDEGKILSRSSQAAQDTLASVQSEETAIVQEWRTEEGAKSLTGQEAAIASELREADIIKKTHVRRNEQATDSTNQEYAALVKSDAKMPNSTETIATVAGGISGRTGISQAKATAQQTVVAAVEKAISAEKTLMSQIKEDVLLDDEIEAGLPGLGSDRILDEPDERIAALAGSIASRRHMLSHIRLWKRMSELEIMANDELAAAKRANDNDAIKEAEKKVGKVKDMQQQVMGDKSKTPFGIGDSDQGDATVGTYSNNIYETTRDRIITHMSVKRMAEMDPDDLKVIHEMAAAGKLSQAALDKIKSVYEAWEKDDNYKSALEPKHRAILDPIVQAATGNRINRPNTVHSAYINDLA